MLFGFQDDSGRVKKPRLAINQAFKAGGTEPRLEDVLADPVIHLRARADKMAPEDLKNQVSKLKSSVFHRQSVPS